MEWTDEQDDVVRELSFLGSKAVAAEIFRRFGVAHSARAVEVRASRIGCSLAVQTVCPACGAVGLKINRQTRLCPRCTARLRVEQDRAFREQLERERAEAMAEAERLGREHDRLRKANNRLCKQYGLPTPRQRGSGGAAGDGVPGDDGG